MRDEHLLTVAAVAAGTFAADQVTKTAASVVNPGPLLPLHNPGLSLGLVDSGRWLETGVMALGVLLAAALLLPRVHRGKLPALPTALLLGGAVSNLLDRAVTGSVRDFLPVGPVVLNVADVAVLAGVVVLAAATVRHTLTRIRDSGAKPGPNPNPR
jgi:lipoprotein signal peptidase